MELINQILLILSKSSFHTFKNINLVYIIYFLFFIILFLENSLILTAFLPGDSLLILSGVLIAKGMLNFFYTIIILTIAASLGSWISYLQGKFLEKNKKIKKLLNYLPFFYYKKSQLLFLRYGLTALFIGRFIAFIRTIMPIIIGLSNFKNIHFQLFNWISSFIWVLTLVSIGLIFMKIPF